MSGFKHAFTLSNKDVTNATPPGTVTLVDHLHRTETHTTHDEIHLVPQPSADPADPLNFSMWRKAGVLASMSLVPFIVNFTSGSIASALPIYAATPIFGFPPKSYGELGHLIAVNVLMLGASNLIWVPLSNIFGRRPIILLGLLILTLSSMWAGLTSNFSSLLAARAIMGIGGGPADAVAPDVVGEVFFVHQRGRVMAVYTVFLALGPWVGPTVGGYIVGNNGLPWLHWTNVILSAIAFVACFFLLPETLYKRSHPTSTYREEVSDKIGTREEERTTSPVSSPDHTYRPYTFLRSMSLVTYHGDVVHKFIAPWLTLRLPGVWLVALWYSGLVGVIVTMSIVGPILVYMPPYRWGSNAGFINIGGIIGTSIGWLYTFLVADWTTKRLAVRNSFGYSEPESRLITALPSFVIATAGTLIFGFVAQNPSPNGWIGLQFGIGMAGFGIMQAPSVGFNYIIESYPIISGDCFVAITCVRAIIAFSWTFFVGEWVTTKGAAEPFGIFGMLLGLFGLLTIPFWIWGKRFRIATAKWVPQSS